jgi:anti-sigma factor RsiW
VASGSTLNFRRPKKPVPWRLLGAGAAVLAVVAVAGGVAAALGNEGSGTDSEPKAAPATTTAASSTQPSAAPTPVTSRSPAVEVITSRNNREFAALLKADTCDEENVSFAAEYAGRTVAFDGSIVHMQSYGDYATRFDLLLGPGDKGPRTTTGPAFKYEDVNVSDLELTGDKVPSTVGEGDKFRFVAEVREFNMVQCLFYLDPVSTQAR